MSNRFRIFPRLVYHRDSLKDLPLSSSIEDVTKRCNNWGGLEYLAAVYAITTYYPLFPIYLMSDLLALPFRVILFVIYTKKKRGD